MAEHTHIEWTDATWQPITGCTTVSPGCANCYAMHLAGTRLAQHPSRAGLTREVNGHHVWTGEVRLNECWLAQPLGWRRPRRIFVCAHGDLFHESVPDAWIDRVFAIMALSPQHTFQVLTKRSDRMRAYVGDATAARRVYTIACDVAVIEDRVNVLLLAPGIVPDPEFSRAQRRVNLGTWPLANVWLGVSAERQQEADARIPDLLATPAVVRFVSAEPLLGPVDLTQLGWVGGRRLDVLQSYTSAPTPTVGVWAHEPHDLSSLSWVIAGGESGPGARPMHPDWARSIRDQCTAAGVPYFFKQWGEWAPGECARAAQTRTEMTATWFGDRWHHSALTRVASSELHRDDEPTVWRLGKRAAGRVLDGRTWDEMPASAGHQADSEPSVSP